MSTESETKTYSWDDLKKPEHQDKKGLLMLIHGKVYSISKFLDEVSFHARHLRSRLLCWAHAHARRGTPKTLAQDILTVMFPSLPINVTSTLVEMKSCWEKLDGMQLMHSRTLATRTKHAQFSKNTMSAKDPT